VLEEAEFPAALAVELGLDRRRARILGECRQHRAGQLQPGIGRALQAGDDAETLGVALVALEIGALGNGQGVAIEQSGTVEPFADGVFPCVTEGRIADVVRQAGSGDDGAEIGRIPRSADRGGR
jgi:hypothetical protein